MSERCGYQWPGSALTWAHHEKLARMSNKTGVPMNRIIAESIDRFYELFTEDPSILRK